MPPWFWRALLGVAAVADVYAAFVRHEGTLSHELRQGFRTNTPRGRSVFTALLVLAACWLRRHLCTWPPDRLPKS